MGIRPYKRRRILIDRFQYRLLIINILYFCTILLIFLATLFLPLILELYSDTLPPSEQAEAATQFLSLHARIWPAVFLVFVLLAVHSILVSHRIAGPLYRFRKIFRAVADGDLSLARPLRKGDYLGKELEMLNEMIESLRARIKTIRDPYTEARTLVGALERTVKGGSRDEIIHSIEGLRSQMDRLQVSLDYFRMDRNETPASEDLAIPVSATSASGDSAPLTRS